MRNANTATRLLTLAECSERTGIPANTFRFWRVQGHTGPKFVRLGRRLVIRESDFNEWLAIRLGETR
jgi:predicted DNA-binding transcriptional regulator AlpA